MPLHLVRDFVDDDHVTPVVHEAAAIHKQCKDEDAAGALRVGQSYVEARREVLAHAKELTCQSMMGAGMVNEEVGPGW
jgi:hypothetical protein